MKSQCTFAVNGNHAFVAKPKFKGANWKSFAPLLKKVTAPLVKEVAKKVIPALGMAAVTGAISCATHKAAAEQKNK